MKQVHPVLIIAFLLLLLLFLQSMVSEQPERFFVSEIIREKIFLNFDKEIPYSSQVRGRHLKPLG